MKTLVIASALALSLGGVAAPAFAEPARAVSAAADAGSTPTVPTSAPSPRAETRRYCVVGTITGSRVPRKECNTRAEWLKQGFDPLAAK